ncbi:EAL domain-containing protein [Modestobacter sp. SSW1-42]|uniref:EAL domain-containing protein n=1 Tax=Modestobacter sp. SSW1-42 TaxID=596372 RepID=UPI003987AF19
MVQAVLALARALGLDVIAEGVEHTHQAQVLRRLGCVHAQGYLYGRPAAASALFQDAALRPAATEVVASLAG